MAESVVFFVASRLAQLLAQEASLLGEVSDEIQHMYIELKRMQRFLKDADARVVDGDESICNWVSEIRDAAYDAEDVIEMYVLRGELKQVSIMKRYCCVFDRCSKLHMVGSEIKAIQFRISRLTERLQTYGVKAIQEAEELSSAYKRRVQHLKRSYSHVVEKDIIGLDGNIEELVAQLVEQRHCRVISICGMGGIGKTTLAKKIYHHNSIRRYFDALAWVCISQEWQTRDVLQEILLKLNPSRRDEILQMKDEDLIKSLYEVQIERKCLVVLDDIWRTEAWDSLRSAFPLGDSSSKIMLTTRNREVALHVDPHGLIHNPRCLNEEEGWELLQKKAFQRGDETEFKMSAKMEKLGREIVGQCGGLPLAIIVIGGLLATKHTLSEWERVHGNITSYLRRGKSHGQPLGVEEVLALSYHDLPYYLKPCFLHLGIFPEDCDIPAEKLYQMWLAEGIIPLDFYEEEEDETMMDIAERFLEELAQRCMVNVQVNESTRRLKSCHLHDLMRELCLSKAKEDNFLKIIHRWSSFINTFGVLSIERSTIRVRRLVIILQEIAGDHHLSDLKTHRVDHVRSLTFFNPSVSTLCWEHLENHLSGFKLLRVLDFEGFRLPGKLPALIGTLVHLRYLSLRNSHFTKLPSSIENLGCLHSLDLRVKSTNLDIPNVLWKLKRLKHLYLPRRINRTEKLQLDGLRSLETLKNIESLSCDINCLSELSNLRKLRYLSGQTMKHWQQLVQFHASPQEASNIHPFASGLMFYLMKN